MENAPGLYQGAHEPLGLSGAGRSVSVSSMPLKGTGEARCKPPRGRAWLRESHGEYNEVDFRPTGKMPPVTSYLAYLMGQSWSTGQLPHRVVYRFQRMTEVDMHDSSLTDVRGEPESYPLPSREPRRAG